MTEAIETETLADETGEVEIDRDANVTRGEIIAMMQNLSHDIQNIVDGFNAAIQQLLVNQASFDERMSVLEDPSKPRIYLPGQ
jgi:hypothetical protein